MFVSRDLTIPKLGVIWYTLCGQHLHLEFVTSEKIQIFTSSVTPKERKKHLFLKNYFFFATNKKNWLLLKDANSPHAWCCWEASAGGRFRYRDEKCPYNRKVVQSEKSWLCAVFELYLISRKHLRVDHSRRISFKSYDFWYQIASLKISPCLTFISSWIGFKNCKWRLFERLTTPFNQTAWLEKFLDSSTFFLASFVVCRIFGCDYCHYHTQQTQGILWNFEKNQSLFNFNYIVSSNRPNHGQ